MSLSYSQAPNSFPSTAELIGGGGLLNSLNHSNGLALWRTYDNDNILGEIGLYDNSTVPQTVRQQRYHSFTDKLSLTNIFDNLNEAENQSFWLHPNGRLQNADGPWGQDLYFHDAVGNRTQSSRTVSGLTTTRIHGYGATNNLLFNITIGAANDRVFSYDAAGNQTGDDRGATLGNFTYVLNRANRIAEARRGGVLQGIYLYDGFERLRSRVVSNQVATANNGTTHYVWDIFGNIIAEADGTTGTTLRETAYLEGLPLAAFNRQVTPVATYAIHVDHLNR